MPLGRPDKDITIKSNTLVMLKSQKSRVNRARLH